MGLLYSRSKHSKAVNAKAGLKNKLLANLFTSNKNVYINRIATDTYHVYRHLGDWYWCRSLLTQNGITTNPYNLNDTEIMSIKSYILAKNTSVTYPAGAWTDITSQNATTYIGGTARYVNGVGAQVQIPFNGGDVYVIFVGRTSSANIKVTIDGSTSLVSTPNFDAYTSTDLKYKQIIKVASNVPAGSHTLTLTVDSTHNISSSGFSFYFNGVAVVSSTSGLPSSADTKAPNWQPSTAYVQYQQVQYQGRNYSCSVAGTSGTVAPTHTSGSATDGTVTWLYMSSSSYSDDYWDSLQVAGSQMEYAYEIQPSGTTVFDDVGGLVHGNENLVSLTVTVDGVLRSMNVGDWANGIVIQLSQSIQTIHSQTGTTNHISTTLNHVFNIDHLNINHSHTFNTTTTLGFFYNAMWPLMHWMAPGYYKYEMDNLILPQGGTFNFPNYYGQSNPIVGRTRDYAIGSTGKVFRPLGNAGTGQPSTEPSKLAVVMYLDVDPQSVEMYKRLGVNYAGCAMNLSGVTPPGFSSVVGKMYFERYSHAMGVVIQSGTIFTCNANYYLGLKSLT